jgi:3-methylcrotonyl-CoA carboxylase alpha subunit
MIRLRCGETRFEAALRETRDRVEVTVDGQAHVVEVEAVAPGVFVIRNGNGVRTFHCVRDGDEIHLSWNGSIFRLVEEAEGRRGGQRAQSGGLEAPMPGKVSKVSVSEGDLVVKGQEILVVEAMKMENAIRAPRDGRVGKIAAQVGDMVSPGVTLVELQ